MAPSTGRHDADESASDRARIDYLAGDADGGGSTRPNGPSWTSCARCSPIRRCGRSHRPNWRIRWWR